MKIIKLTDDEFNMLIDKLQWMDCVVKDSDLNYKDYCNGDCGAGCNRPDLCNFKKWMEAKIINNEN